MAFELPDYAEWDPKFAETLIPLQILRSVNDASLETLLSSEQRRGGQRARIRAEPLTSSQEVDTEWVPSLQ
jgi:hypothetical protein